MIEREFDATDEMATKDVRSKLLEYLEAETGDSRALVQVEEIFNELVSNVRNYGARRATVAIVWRADRAAVMEVTDRGPGFELSNWQSPPALSEHGYGLVIASALAEDVTILPGPDGVGTLVRVVLPIPRRIVPKV